MHFRLIQRIDIVRATWHRGSSLPSLLPGRFPSPCCSIILFSLPSLLPAILPACSDTTALVTEHLVEIVQYTQCHVHTPLGVVTSNMVDCLQHSQKKKKKKKKKCGNYFLYKEGGGHLSKNGQIDVTFVPPPP
jgi:hypothetical protein